MGKKQDRITAGVWRAIEGSGLSRYAIAKASGVSEAALSRFMSGERPAVHVAAAYSKHRRDDVLPLRPDTAAGLGDMVAQMFPQEHPFGIHDKGAAMLRADLKAARGKWIADARDTVERRRRRQSDFLRPKDASPGA